jgi:predicted AAA+ superfamily ATPase
MINQIKVIIEKSQNASSFDRGESFFKEELDQAKELISNFVKKIKSEEDNKQEKYKNQEGYFHQHNTIAILGPRGVGKTSFLLSLKENYFKKA